MFLFFRKLSISKNFCMQKILWLVVSFFVNGRFAENYLVKPVSDRGDGTESTCHVNSEPHPP